MSRWILIALILLTVAGLHPAPVTATDIPSCWDGERLRPMPGRRYRVASRVEDDWGGSSSMMPMYNQLEPVPGMPQALGFDSWEAVYDDLISLDGVISDVGLWFAEPGVGGEFRTNFVQYPAGLIPEGVPVVVQPDVRWMYFRWDSFDFSLTNLAYVRFQHDPGGPILYLERATDYPWDVEFALYVKL
ncbi:MAG: hypothetical protein OXH72_15155 [Caldilineaceae bacterium]|nr:hypothetical protein [Caldilineaceae bacterium]